MVFCFGNVKNFLFAGGQKIEKKSTILFCLKVLGHAFLGAKYEVEFSMQRH